MRRIDDRQHPREVIRMRILGALLFALILIASAQAFAADGAALYESNCRRCHGAEGKSDTTMGARLEIPPVAGQKAASVVEVVKAGGRRHDRPNENLSDEELEAIGALIEGL
jgi:mono/diheme cytochrome c family protein